jgi:hypothetical protein
MKEFHGLNNVECLNLPIYHEKYLQNNPTSSIIEGKFNEFAMVAFIK